MSAPGDDLAAVVERLSERADVDGNWPVVQVERADLRTLLSSHKERGEALEPFANAADEWSPGQNGGHVFDDEVSASSESSLSVGDLRRARTALSPNPEAGG